MAVPFLQFGGGERRERRGSGRGGGGGRERDCLSGGESCIVRSLSGSVWFHVAAGGSVWCSSGTGGGSLVKVEVCGM